MNLMSASHDLASNDGLAEGQSADYVRIGDVARQFGVTLRALRFYEDKGLIAKAIAETLRESGAEVDARPV
jgi:hypothetical protein